MSSNTRSELEPTTASALLKRTDSEKSEIWRPIAKATGYEVSSLGRVKNPKGRILEPIQQKSGLLVSIQSHKKYIRRLVAEAFLTTPSNKEDYFCINKNGDFTDNSFENVEWVKRSTYYSSYGRQAKFVLYRERTIRSSTEEKLASSSFTVDF